LNTKRHKGRRSRLKILIAIACVFLIIISGYAIAKNWLLINTNSRFPYHSEYREFTIRSDKPLQEKLKQDLDSVAWRLSSVLGYDKGTYKIYICNLPETYGPFARRVGRPVNTQGFNLEPLNYIFINASFINEVKLQNQSEYKYSILEGNLAHIIAHEICHQLITAEIGYFTMRKIETWKIEGFCEYAASKRVKLSDPKYQFGKQVVDFQNGKYQAISPGRRFYIESQICVEYYLDYRNKNFVDLLEEDLSREGLIKEISETV